jgi:hypothetical protein
MFNDHHGDEFLQERTFVAKKFNCKISDIEFDDNHPTGEVCIFVKGNWCGYVDNEFYREMFNK